MDIHDGQFRQLLLSEVSSPCFEPSKKAGDLQIVGADRPWREVFDRLQVIEELLYIMRGIYFVDIEFIVVFCRDIGTQ